MKIFFEKIKKYWFLFLPLITTAFGLLIYAIFRIRVGALLKNSKEEVKVINNQIEAANIKDQMKHAEKKLKNLEKKRKKLSSRKKKTVKKTKDNLEYMKKRYAKIISMCLCLFIFSNLTPIKQIKKGETIKAQQDSVVISIQVFNKISIDLRRYEELEKDHKLLQDQLSAAYRVIELKNKYIKTKEKNYEYCEKILPEYFELKRKRKARIIATGATIGVVALTSLTCGLIIGLTR